MSGNKPSISYSAGGVVINGDGLILITSQRGTSWSLPKGHIEKDEDELAAAKREVAEETGITQLELIKDLGSYQRYKISLSGGDDHKDLKSIHMFLFKTNQSKLNPKDINNPEARWVRKEKVSQLLTHQKDKDFFLQILNQIPV